jgi:citrate lyase beta subunit
MIAKAPPSSPRRAWLFTPGDNEHRLAKAAGLTVDVVILDLDDGVGPGQKAEARHNVVTAVTTLDFGLSERFIRVNAPDSDLFADDIAAIADLPFDGLILPKIETAAQIHHVIDTFANKNMPLFPFIETALAVMNVKEIAQASDRVAGLLLGAEDLAASLGAVRSTDGWEIFYARSAIVTAAAAYDLAAIDTVFVDIHNIAALTAESQWARQLGFTGKLAIHPAQIAPMQRAFAPTPAEIIQAEEIVAAYQKHIAEGAGAFTLHGRMVDRPVVLAAEQLLARAQACAVMDRKGKSDDS